MAVDISAKEVTNGRTVLPTRGRLSTDGLLPAGRALLLIVARSEA
jgi:hypothetical protein